MEKQTNFDFSDNDKIVSANFHNFAENKEIIGILEKIEEGTYGEQYVLTTQSGESVTVGSYTALKSKLNNEAVGKAVKIVYKGEVKSENGRLYKDFDVYIKK